MTRTSVWLASIVIWTAMPVAAQIGSSGSVGISADETKQVALGKSVKKDILGKPVYNGEGDSIGSIEDLIITSDATVPYAIVGVGGFLGLDTYDVAIPVNRFKSDTGRLVLIGATKDNLKKLPEIKYAK